MCMYVSGYERDGFLGGKKPEAGTRRLPCAEHAAALAFSKRWCLGLLEAGVLGVVRRKVAFRMVKIPQLPPRPACGARLDRNFEQRGLGAGWRAGFLC